MVEIDAFEDLREILDKADEAYKESLYQGAQLQSTNPNKLTAVLNYSMFLFQVKGNCVEAQRMARRSLEVAI